MAKVHPALVADPTHYQSLFAACGRQLSPDIKTITAKTLFQRLGHLEKAFDSRHQEYCEQLALRRNVELHSGESPFSGMSAEIWEREFWGAVETVLRMQNESLESWLGAEDSKAPTEIVEKAREALQWAVKNRVSRCKEDFFKKYQDPKRRQEVIDQSETPLFASTHFLFRGFDGHGRAPCPSCDSLAFVAGALWNEEVIDSEDNSVYDEEGNLMGEDPIETVEKTFSTEEFSCPTCGLGLFGTNEIAAADLPEDFSRREDRERDFGPKYGND